MTLLAPSQVNRAAAAATAVSSIPSAARRPMPMCLARNRLAATITEASKQAANSTSSTSPSTYTTPMARTPKAIQRRVRAVASACIGIGSGDKVKAQREKDVDADQQHAFEPRRLAVPRDGVHDEGCARDGEQV